MTRILRSKINHLLKLAPKGSVLTSTWLKKQGVSLKLSWWYVHSGWLDRVGEGAFKLAGDHVTWISAINALQDQLNMPVHVGGKSALQLLGQSHYVPKSFAYQTIQLFSPQGVKLPTWMNSSTLEKSFKLHATSLFKDLSEEKIGLHPQQHNDLKVYVSAPERAAIEVCYLAPKFVSLDEAALLLENLSRLRPQLVQTLLEGCTSIKAKRLFLYFSEHYEHEWAKELDLSKLNLGSGKQTISGGGVYNAKYKLSLPPMRNDGWP